MASGSSDSYHCWRAWDGRSLRVLVGWEEVGAGVLGAVDTLGAGASPTGVPGRWTGLVRPRRVGCGVNCVVGVVAVFLTIEAQRGGSGWCVCWACPSI